MKDNKINEVKLGDNLYFISDELKKERQRIIDTCYKELDQMYSGKIPPKIAARIGVEIEYLDNPTTYLVIAHSYRIVQLIKKMNGRFTAYGTIVECFISFLLKITSFNPLDNEYAKEVPVCYGYGIYGDKAPFVTFSVSNEEIYEAIVEYIKENDVSDYVVNVEISKSEELLEKLEINCGVVDLSENIDYHQLLCETYMTPEEKGHYYNMSLNTKNTLSSVCGNSTRNVEFAVKILDNINDLICKIKPKTKYELFRIIGWCQCGELLGVARELELDDLADVFLFREDLYEAALELNLERTTAYKFAERVRRGRIIEQELEIVKNSKFNEVQKNALFSTKYLTYRGRTFLDTIKMLQILSYKKLYPNKFDEIIKDVYQADKDVFGLWLFW